MPGLLILLLSMMALHSTVNVISSQKYFVEDIVSESSALFELHEEFSEFEKSFHVYSYAPNVQNLKEVRKRYSGFMATFFHRHEAQGVLNSRKYKEALYEIDRLLLPLSLKLRELSTEKNSRAVASVSASVEEVHEKIANLVLIFSERIGEGGVEPREHGYDRALLYWAVIALGFAGFILALLNANKLHKLKEASDEKLQNLELMEQRLEAIEGAFDGIGIIDEGGNLTYMNAALLELHGIPKDEADDYIGTSWGSLYSDKGQEFIDTTVMPIVKSHKVWHGESPIARKDGKVLTAELFLRALPSGGYIGTARDISEQRKNEKEKEELQEQFFQAQKMEAIGRIAGGVAHDFNNILASMNGYAEFLSEDLEEGSPEHGFALNILKAGKQARVLVDQILAFSRRKDNTADNQSVDLVANIKENISMLMASLPKTVEVETNYKTQQAQVNGNGSQLSQLVMNLCVNAVDAMEGERGKLEISIQKSTPEEEAGVKDMLLDDLPSVDEAPLSRIEDVSPVHARLHLSGLSKNHDYWMVKVADNGTGMSRKIMEQVFEPFFTTKAVGKGTGLGLAMAHGVIVNHRGAMVIDSVLNKGTTFYLYFPIGTAEKEKEEEVYEENISLEGQKILVVDDQKEVRDVTESMLERMGAEAYSCGSALEALEVLRENEGMFDLVLTDQNMPKMTGLDLVNQIYIDQPDLPFVVLSGYSEEKLQELIQQHDSIKAVLKKPITTNALAAAIARVMKGRGRTNNEVEEKQQAV